MRIQTTSQKVLSVWEGFSDRFQNLAETATDHYLLMPIATFGVIAGAVAWPLFGMGLTLASLGLIGIKAYQASSNYFLEGREAEGLTQFGETIADTTLLAGGLALGKAGQTVTQAKSGTSAGVALHLVDEVAASILFIERTLFHH